MQHKFAFFGTPYVARDTLATLYDVGYVPEVVITAPDAPRGRGMVLTPTETKTWALEHQLPVLTPEKLDEETIREILSYDCEYAIVVAYGKILPESLINAFPRGVLNIHYSLLPKYRGASPVESALLHNEAITGITIQKMVKELDAGDILSQRETAIESRETTRELRPRLITLGAQLLLETLPGFLDGSIVPLPQDHALATKCGKIKKEEGELSLTGDAQTNWNKYRAYAESPGTYFYADRNDTRVRVKIKQAQFENGVFTPTRVVPEGKSEMAYEDFVRAQA